MPQPRRTDDLDQRNADHATEIYLLIGAPEAVALTCGFVPLTVREQARAAIDWEHWASRRPRRRNGGRR